MDNYNLEPNEFMIMKSEDDIWVRNRSDEYCTLMLTNQNVVIVIDPESRKQQIRTYQVSQIKMYNGQAQALVNKKSGSSPQLEIYFFDGQETFEFESKNEAVRWAENINNLLIGKQVNFINTEKEALPGTKFVATKVKDTLDTVKNVFGLKSKSGSNPGPGIVTKKCLSCGAPILGNAGHMVKCRYCDTDQAL